MLCMLAGMHVNHYFCLIVMKVVSARQLSVKCSCVDL